MLQEYILSGVVESMCWDLSGAEERAEFERSALLIPKYVLPGMLFEQLLENNCSVQSVAPPGNLKSKNLLILK